MLIVAVVALVVGWLVLTHKDSPSKRREHADYRQQHTENPDYFPGHGGQAVG